MEERLFSKKENTKSNLKFKCPNFFKKSNFSPSKILMTIIISVLIVLGGASYALANTHSSTASLTPGMVSEGEEDVLFTVEITHDSGDYIDEVRIWHKDDFTNYNCETKSGWNLIEGETSGQEWCLYTTDVGTSPIGDGYNSETFEFEADVPDNVDPEDCCFNHKFETRDVEDYWLAIFDSVCVDGFAPETTKTYLGPQYPENINENTPYPHWIDTVSEVQLEAEDEICEVPGCECDDCGDCEVTTYYNVESTCNVDCETQENCEGWTPHNHEDNVWEEYDGPFQINESCHVIEFWSEDSYGNKEDVKWQCVFSDHTAPEINREITGPHFTEDDEQYDLIHWVNHETDIEFACEDLEPHPSGHEELCFKVSYDEDPDGYNTDEYCSKYSGEGAYMQDSWCCVTSNEENPFVFNFNEGEDSFHDLEYLCKDAVDKKSDVATEYFRVDTTAPVIDKNLNGPRYGTCDLEDPAADCWIQDFSDAQIPGLVGTLVEIDSHDEDPTDNGCASNEVECKWWYVLDGNWTSEEDFASNEFGIKFLEDTEHELFVECWDQLENKNTYTKTFYVDSQAPETNKTYIGPYHSECESEWIDTVTTVDLSGEDNPEAPCASGVKETNYRVIGPVADSWCYSDCENWDIGNPQYSSVDWETYDGTPFGIDEESCHIIEYYSVDNLDIEENIKWQCVFADHTAPEVNKEIGKPSKSATECIDLGGDGFGITEYYNNEREGTEYSGDGMSGSEGGVCDSATQQDQCAEADSNSLPPYARDALISQGIDPATLDGNCGDILILSSGDPLDESNDISTPMSNSGCGLNPDNYSTNDCVTLDFTPEENSVVVAVSSEFPYYYEDVFTDWMRIGGIKDVSIRDWEPDNIEPHENTEIISYGNAPDHKTGVITLASLTEDQQVELRVADSGDEILDTMLIVVPLSCFEDDPEPILCGDGVIDEGEECEANEDCSGGEVCQACFCVNEPEEHTECNYVDETCNIVMGSGEDECTTDADCEVECTDVNLTYVTSETPITFTCEDQGDHPVGNEEICFKVSYDVPSYPTYVTDSYCSEIDGAYMEGDYCCVSSTPEDSFVFYFNEGEDSFHDLEYFCRDAVNKTSDEHIQYYKVDDTAPTTTKTLLPPLFTDYLGECEDYCHDNWQGNLVVAEAQQINPSWPSEQACIEDKCELSEWIDTESSIELESEDGGDICHVGVDKIWYLNYVEEEEYGACYDPKMYCESEVANPYEQESHDGCIDDCQNGNTPYEDCTQYDVNTEDWYDCVEGCAHNACGVDDEWKLYRGEPIQKNNESCHIFQYLSVDHLGNVEDMNVNCFFVDKTPPETTKDYGEPYFFRQDEERCIEWGEPICNPFCVPIQFFGYGGMGQPECPEWCLTTPCINWTSIPDAKFINNYTNLTLAAIDPEPHPSGVNYSKYRVTLLDDDKYCEDLGECEVNATGEGNWMTYDGPFTVPEESCHLIEYYSVDNVEKTETVKKQCVFVDTTAPEPNKTVAEPSSKWYPVDPYDNPGHEDATYFYPDIVDRCWNGEADSIDCWKVTQHTDIYLDCEDPEPHPVNNEEVCFKVGVDAQDGTDYYCEEYSGDYNKYGDGYCCVNSNEGEMYEHEEHDLVFHFLEDTEHNLKYYCIDALGNKGPVDDEKFKVEGEVLEIPLYFKWNLISVPFNLLESHPDEVFEDVEGVESVWSYDGATDTWHVYTPDGDSTNDDIDAIEPGYGYWVLETNQEPAPPNHELKIEQAQINPGDKWGGPSEWLKVGGSLFNQGPNSAPTRPLTEGWNLIGYYADEWWQQYEWSDGFECGDSMVMFDNYLYGDKAYCALSSLVDPSAGGYPRWSSVWSFINCGNHQTKWVPVNSCDDKPVRSRMYAGRGYWIEMDQADNYAPATECMMDDDIQCIWPV